MMNNLNSKEYIVIFKFKDWIHETVAGYTLMLLLFKSNQSNEMLSTGIFFWRGHIFLSTSIALYLERWWEILKKTEICLCHLRINTEGKIHVKQNSFNERRQS